MNMKCQRQKHSHYEYTTYRDQDYRQYYYIIHIEDDYQGNIECDEYYDTRDCADKAAIEHINRLEEGPDEPDYDAPTFQETYQRAWEQSQELKRR